MTPPSKQRSAVSNGKRLFVVRPGDTAWARRFRDVLAEITSDLGGADLLSEGQRQLARRAATIAIACERLEGEAAAGNAIDLVTYGMLVDRMGRCFDRLGLKRQACDVTKSLHEILHEHQSARELEAISNSTDANPVPHAAQGLASDSDA
jgi:hypothetical protein